MSVDWDGISIFYENENGEVIFEFCRILEIGDGYENESLYFITLKCG